VTSMNRFSLKSISLTIVALILSSSFSFLVLAAFPVQESPPNGSNVFANQDNNVYILSTVMLSATLNVDSIRVTVSYAASDGSSGSDNPPGSNERGQAHGNELEVPPGQSGGHPGQRQGPATPLEQGGQPPYQSQGNQAGNSGGRPADGGVGNRGDIEQGNREAKNKNK